MLSEILDLCSHLTILLYLCSALADNFLFEDKKLGELTLESPHF